MALALTLRRQFSSAASRLLTRRSLTRLGNWAKSFSQRTLCRGGKRASSPRSVLMPTLHPSVANSNCRRAILFPVIKTRKSLSGKSGDANRREKEKEKKVVTAAPCELCANFQMLSFQFQILMLAFIPFRLRIPHIPGQQLEGRKA